MKKKTELQVIALLAAGIGMAAGSIATLLVQQGKAKLIHALKKLDDKDLEDEFADPEEDTMKAEAEDIFEEE